MDDKYSQIVIEWKEFSLPKYYERDSTVNVHSIQDLILTIYGPRKAGKTYFMYQLIDTLKRKNNINPENIFFLNLEDDRLFPLSTHDLDLLLEKFEELSKLSSRQKKYLFLDEIQNLENWSKWLLRIYSKRKDIQLIISGSSAKLLSKEIATELRGSNVSVELLPVSFKEYVHSKAITITNHRNLFYSKEKIGIKKLFNEYFSYGSYPKILFEKPDKELKKEILQNYFETMLLRDIAERHNIRSISALKTLAKLMFNSIAKEFSYNKITNNLTNIGFSLSKTTIIEYISYFEDAYLFFQNMNYFSSLKKQLASIKKIYTLDTELLRSVSFRVFNDTSLSLENLVYIELKRRKHDIYYYTDII